MATPTPTGTVGPTETPAPGEDNGCLPDENGRLPIQWATAVGWCVYDGLQVASRFIGLSSIVFWFFAQFPQIWENYKLKSARALSAGFLLLWTLGDSTNLIGCAILIGYGDVVATQLYLAIYFCCIDLLLWSQFIYYNYVYPRMHLQLTPSAISINEQGVVAPSESEESQALLGGTKSRSLLVAGGALMLLNAVLPGGAMPARAAALGGRALLQTDGAAVSAVNPEVVGEVFAWVCAALYLGSRMPQIYLNWKRQSVHGLALTLFLFAVMGNVTYVASILLASVERDFLLGQLPYLLGSGGTLVFDAIIFFQFYKYRYAKPKELRAFDSGSDDVST